ncbi:MAG TPA: hypothetical protein VFA05_06800 [Gaiellaceae bacterium]|nr:hypothetical protein [Gaiellaceae bacterium]
MIRAAIRRVLVLVGVIAAGTVVGSTILGLIAGSGLARSISVGFYVVGTAVLVGSFVMGSRGPLRPEWGEGGRPSGAILPRAVRRATPEERTESVRVSLLLFALGIGLVLVGALVDPTRRFF